jgi:hypothetical protein
MKLTPRRKIVLALVAVMAVAGYVVVFGSFGASIKDAQRISIGMKGSEVERILGRQADEYYYGRVADSLCWNVSDGKISVLFGLVEVNSVSVLYEPRWLRLVDQAQSFLGLNVVAKPEWVEIAQREIIE